MKKKPLIVKNRQTKNLLLILAVVIPMVVAAAITVLSNQDEEPLSSPQNRDNGAASWHIRGKLSEACTCDVPCTCNFGEDPTPHDYCYAAWSYWIEEGEFQGVSLNNLQVGGVEGERGFRALLDVRGNPAQRRAMEELTYALGGRMVCLVRLWPLKASATKLIGAKSRGQGSILHTSYLDREFLGFDYVNIGHEITNHKTRLQFGERGGFEANFIMGRDSNRPVTVTNNVSWPIEVSIKGKTTYFRYEDKDMKLDYRGTNCNHGVFDISSDNEGARPMMQ